MQRDLVLRWLEQMRLLIARILRGDRDAGTELAEAELDQAMAQLLGGAAGLVQRLDVPSVGMLLSDPDRIYGYAQAVALKAALVRARGGRPEEAEALADRAQALAREAYRRSSDPPPEWKAWIEAMEEDRHVLPR
ncbi:MAG: hypothetical protein FJ206_14580 [Gemmatimonadetes bacterium]|nr:hypothetical protein [Gemmatimonadota bacterium]